MREGSTPDRQNFRSMGAELHRDLQKAMHPEPDEDLGELYHRPYLYMSCRIDQRKMTLPTPDDVRLNIRADADSPLEDGTRVFREELLVILYAMKIHHDAHGEWMTIIDYAQSFLKERENTLHKEFLEQEDDFAKQQKRVSRPLIGRFFRTKMIRWLNETAKPARADNAIEQRCCDCIRNTITFFKQQVFQSYL